jgi:hypothetical protein
MDATAYSRAALRLLRHGERAWQGDLDGPISVPLEKSDERGLHGLAAPDLADHARHRHGLSRPVHGCAGIVEVHALQGVGEPVRVAFPPHLAVGDDVHAGAMLILQGDDRGVVLGLFEGKGVHLPQGVEQDSGRQPLAEPIAIYEPRGLCVAADQRGR